MGCSGLPTEKNCNHTEMYLIQSLTTFMCWGITKLFTYQLEILVVKNFHGFHGQTMKIKSAKYNLHVTF